MKYRPEVDGLRAIAVLAVFLYHLGDKSASGGLVGVDVFFVISGYLITTLVYTERKTGRFSLTGFYVRRIKRIAPALLATILLVMGAGYLILGPDDYDALARSSLFALAGASNFFFWQNTGYFDAAAETMPLLHTWSLGVEEQFYVVWPGLLILLWRIFGNTRNSLLTALLMLIAASLAAYLLLNSTYPKLAFYMPFSRAWEFALGGVIAFLPEIANKRFARVKKLLPGLGILLIGGAVLQFRSPVDFTGDKVVAAAIGAFLIIYAVEAKSLSYQVLSSKPLVFIGKISYSLYLCHLPLIVLWKDYAGVREIQREYHLLFIAVAVVISWLSWRYIEQPCRRAQWRWKAVFSAFCAGELAMGCLCAAVVVTQGTAARAQVAVQGIRSLEAMWDWTCPSYHTLGGSALCTGGVAWDSATAHAVIWGDSNAGHFMPLLDVVARQQNVSISLLAACSPIIAFGYAIQANMPATYMAECDELNHSTIDLLKSSDISLVILAAAWARVTPMLYKTAGDRLGMDTGLMAMAAALNRLLPQISAAGRTVAIISQVPNWFADPIPCIIAVQTRLLRSASFRQTCRDKIDHLDKAYFLQFQKQTDDLLRSFNGKYGTVVLSPADSLCSAQSCAAIVDGEFIYRDEGHFRRDLKEQTKEDLANLLHFSDLMALAKKAREGTAGSPVLGTAN
jgi:peptidoglycan/LPS O-acetylase OafA/YrhL